MFAPHILPHFLAHTASGDIVVGVRAGAGAIGSDGAVAALVMASVLASCGRVVAAAAAAGANVFVSGSALFNHPDGLAGGTKDLRQRAEDAQG